MSKAVRVAVLGLGRLGTIHLENLIETGKNVVVQHIVDPIETLAKEKAEKYGIPSWSTDPKVACMDPNVDAVIITTPTQTHAELVTLAAQNKKHIFVEKPITNSLEEVDEVLKAINENNVLCQVGFMRRFHPKFMQAKQQIVAGKIGKPVYFKGFTRDNPPDKYPISPKSDFLVKSGGIFRDLAIHDFDLARFLMGSDVVSVRSSGKIVMNPSMAAYGDIDQASIYLEFASGAVGDIESSRNSPYGFDSGCEIIGTEGAIQIPTIRDQELTVLDIKGTHDLGTIFPSSLSQAFATEINAFIQAVLEGKATLCTEHDGVAALQIAVAADKSFKTNSQIELDKETVLN